MSLNIKHFPDATQPPSFKEVCQHFGSMPKGHKIADEKLEMLLTPPKDFKKELIGIPSFPSPIQREYRKSLPLFAHFSHTKRSEFQALIRRIDKQIKTDNREDSKELLRNILSMEWKWISLKFSEQVEKLDSKIAVYFFKKNPEVPLIPTLKYCKGFFEKLI